MPQFFRSAVEPILRTGFYVNGVAYSIATHRPGNKSVISILNYISAIRSRFEMYHAKVNAPSPS